MLRCKSTSSDVVALAQSLLSVVRGGMTMWLRAAIVFVLGSASIAAAAPPTPAAKSSLERQIARHARYFDGAHRAVTSGGVGPHAKTWSVGATAGAVMFGGSLGAGGGVVTERGMEQKVLVGNARASFGPQVAAGPHVLRQESFGAPRRRGKELVQRGNADLRDFGGAAFGGEVKVKGDRPVSRTATVGFEPGLGFTIGAFGQTAVKLGAPRKSQLLRTIENGRAEVVAAQTMLARGDERGATQALARASQLRQEVRASKRAFNRRRADLTSYFPTAD